MRESFLVFGYRIRPKARAAYFAKRVLAGRVPGARFAPHQRDQRNARVVCLQPVLSAFAPDLLEDAFVRALLLWLDNQALRFRLVLLRRGLGSLLEICQLKQVSEK